MIRTMRLVTVVETPIFQRRAAELMDESEVAVLVEYLAQNPTAGDLVPGSGGVRKLRWRLPGQGKRGGARVIHYFRDEEFPLVLVDIYSKSERADLSPADLARIGKLIAELKQGKRRQ